MLRTTISSLNKTFRTSIYNVSCAAVNVQTVRWARKPRKPIHLGTAKSKMFRVPERKKVNPEEQQELMRLNKNYKTAIRSLQYYLAEEVVQHEAKNVSGRIVVTPEEEAADLERCRQINAAWNEKCAAERNERLAQERADKRDEILAALEAKEQLDAEKFELTENLVRHEKDQSATFILPDQIDEAIEEALANPTDFNFAIDLRENIYYGRRTEPKTKQLPDSGGDKAQSQLGPN